MSTVLVGGQWRGVSRPGPARRCRVRPADSPGSRGPPGRANMQRTVWGRPLPALFDNLAVTDDLRSESGSQIRPGSTGPDLRIGTIGRIGTIVTIVPLHAIPYRYGPHDGIPWPSATTENTMTTPNTNTATPPASTSGTTGTVATGSAVTEPKPPVTDLAPASPLPAGFHQNIGIAVIPPKGRGNVRYLVARDPGAANVAAQLINAKRYDLAKLMFLPQAQSKSVIAGAALSVRNPEFARVCDRIEAYTERANTPPANPFAGMVVIETK